MAHLYNFLLIVIIIYIIISYTKIYPRHKFCICHYVRNVNFKYGGYKYGNSKMESHEGYDEYGKGV